MVTNTSTNLFGKKHDDDSSSSSSSSDDDQHNADGHKRKGLFGGKKRDHGDAPVDGQKRKHKRKGLFGGKKHDKHKLTDKDREPVAVAQPTTLVDPTPDMHKLRDGDVVSHGEKVKDKYELTEADHIGDKYISKKGWDLGQNLGKRYEDADSYKLKDADRHYVPDIDKKAVETRPGETVVAPTHGAPVVGAPVVDAPVVGAPVVGAAPAAHERITVPSAHGERVYGHELKDGDRPGHLHREEGGILSDEHRQDKHLKDKDYATEVVTEEPHKKPGVIAKAIEKVKEKFSSNKSSDVTDPAADKGQHWEKVPDERTEGHWKDRGVGDKHKSKETY